LLIFSKARQYKRSSASETGRSGPSTKSAIVDFFIEQPTTLNWHIKTRITTANVLDNISSDKNVSQAGKFV